MKHPAIIVQPPLLQMSCPRKYLCVSIKAPFPCPKSIITFAPDTNTFPSSKPAMEEEPPTPPTPAQPTSPFWLPSSSTRPHHRFRPTSAIVFNTSFVVVLLSLSAIAFLAALTPSLISYTSHVLRPSSIKKGWDSVNLLLVAFAVVCGFIGRKDGTAEDEGQGFKDAPPQTPRLARSELSYNNWYPYGVQANTNTITNNINGVQLRRNSSSHPDLRQEISWENDMRPRYFDDSYVGNYESPRLVTTPAAAAAAESFRSQKVERDEQNGSHVEVASALSEDSAPPPSPPVSLLPAAPDAATDSKKQELQSVRRRGRRKKRLAAQSQPPSPPELAEVGQQDYCSGEETPKKRDGVTKDLIASIYQSKRKKNRNRRSHESLEDFVHSPQNPNPNPSSPFFDNIFSSKKGKRPSKKGRASASHSIASFTKTKTRFTPKPTTNRANFIDQTAGDGSESPWIRIPPPPPPPPPPFKFRSWKFNVEGDYVNIANSPKCGGVGDSDSDASTPMAQPPVSCPSPDVNHKAEDFIAMFKAKLKLEKMNSIQQRKEAGIGFSPLGPDSSPGPT